MKPDDGKEHGMGAIKEEAVLDGMNAERCREVRGPAAVPARAMPRFRFDVVANAHSPMLPARTAERPLHRTTGLCSLTTGHRPLLVRHPRRFLSNIDRRT
jgi:hypothetical protein